MDINNNEEKDNIYINFYNVNYIIEALSKKLINEFDNGFSAVSIRRMCRFYEYYPNWSIVLTELSWTHFQG